MYILPRTPTFLYIRTAKERPPNHRPSRRCASHKHVGAVREPPPRTGPTSRFHPFDQTGPPLRGVEGLGVVAGVAPDPPVLELEDGHYGKDPPFAVVVDALHN